MSTLVSDEKDRRVCTIPAGGRSRSYNPSPKDDDTDFLEELGDICLSAFKQCMNQRGYAERARENRERVHALQEAERAVTVASGYERLDEGALGDMTANNLYLVPLEVGLRIKLGIPAGLDETELTSVAVAALVDACSKRKASTRLAI